MKELINKKFLIIRDDGKYMHGMILGNDSVITSQIIRIRIISDNIRSYYLTGTNFNIRSCFFDGTYDHRDGSSIFRRCAVFVENEYIPNPDSYVPTLFEIKKIWTWKV